MNPTAAAPPRLALWLLCHRLPPQETEFVIGDLEERFHAISQERGLAAARRWYWAKALSIALHRWPTQTSNSSARSGDGPVVVLIRDVRYGLRTLRRSPLFAGLVVLTFAIGLGATAAIFSVLDPVLLRGAPYPSADRLLLVWGRDKDGTQSNMGFLTFRDVVRESHSLSSAAVMSNWTPILHGREDSERLSGQRVSSQFFATLGVKPELGRDFQPDEDHSSTRTVVILSHGLWQRRFGGDPGIVGRTIQLSDRSYTVVGVMPESYESLLSSQAELWGPLGYEDSDPWACRSCQHLRMVARLRDGVSEPTAAAELHRISAEMVRANPTEYPAVGLLLTPLNDYLTRGVKPALLATAGAVVLLLLIACVNVMNLFLGRATRRTTEFAVRSALGADSGPLVRQVLVEAVVLALVGGALGVAFAYAAVAGLLRLAPAGVPRIDQVAVNLDVLLFTLLMATLAGVAAGLAPALSALRASLTDLLRRGGRGSDGSVSRRVRTALVVAEVALALILLAGAGLLVRSSERLLAVDPGFNPTGLVTLELEASGSRFDSVAVYQFYRSVIERVGAMPGVTGVAAVSQLPLSGDFDAWGVHLESRPNANPAEDPSAFRFAVTPQYLSTMQIPVLRGRGLTPTDDARAPLVILINRTMANKLFPDEEPIGQRLKIGGTDGDWRTIVGVVGDIHHQSLDAEQELEMYVPTTQTPYVEDRLVLVVRGSTNPSLLVPSIRQAIREIDPAVPIATIATMEEHIRTRSATQRFALAIFQVFALVALILAALGLYGVLSGSVTERTREIGIRSALGAPRLRLFGLVVRDAMTLTVAGMGLGVGGALLLSRLLRSLLYGVTPTDPTTFAVVAVLLLVVALAAATVPAWRAVRVDPGMVLRGE